MSDDAHLDPTVPGNPAYHFTIVPPGSPVRAGWGSRGPLVPARPPRDSMRPRRSAARSHLRRSDAADLPVVHVRVPRRLHERGVRLHPQRESDARGARRGDRAAGGRSGRHVHEHRHERGGRRAEPPPQGQPPPQHRGLLRRHLSRPRAREGDLRAGGHLPRPRGSGRRRRGDPAEHADDLDRDPIQSALAPHRRRCGRGARAAAWSPRRRRQHVPLTGLAAAVPARRRSRGPLDHEVPERAQRRRGRRRRGRPWPDRAGPADPERQQPARHLAEPTRLLPRPARAQDAAPADARARGGGAGGRRVSRRASSGREGALPRARDPPAARARAAAAERLRRHGELRAGRRPPRPRRSRPQDAALVHARREPGRRGEPGRSPRLHDPRVDEPRGARARRASPTASSGSRSGSRTLRTCSPTSTRRWPRSPSAEGPHDPRRHPLWSDERRSCA